MIVSAAAKINGDMANEKRTGCLLKTAGPYYGFNKKNQKFAGNYFFSN